MDRCRMADAALVSVDETRDFPSGNLNLTIPGWEFNGNLSWVVVWNMAFIFPYIGNVIIPTDELIFFRGVGQPPTRGIYLWNNLSHEHFRRKTHWVSLLQPDVLGIRRDSKHQNHRMCCLGLTIKILGISFFQLMVDRLWGLWYLVNCGNYCNP